MEHIRKCNVCGKIWCYTDEDINQNAKNAVVAGLSSIGAIANVFVGTRYDAYEQTKMSDRAADKIRDFSKCPECGSTDIRDISAEDLSKMQKNAGVSKTISINANASVDNIVRRIELFMEDEAWDDAATYCEQALDLEPDNGYLWLMKLLISYKWRVVDGALVVNQPFSGVKIEESEYYERIKKFADKDAELKKKVDKIKNDVNEYLYSAAVENYTLVSSDSALQSCEVYDDVKQKFIYIKDYKDSARYIKLCQDKKNKIIYLGAVKKLESDSIDDIKEAKAIFTTISHWNDANSKIDECQKRIEELEREEKAAAAKRKKVLAFIISGGVIVVAVLSILVTKVIPAQQTKNAYEHAILLYEEANYDEAITAFKELEDYKDSKEYIIEAQYAKAISLYESEKFETNK